MRRGLYWTAVVVAALLVAGGGALAVLRYRDSGGPDGAVRGYFAALARGDAATALAYGTVPDGPHTLLTGPVLAAQQRTAPIRHVTVVSTEQSGARAQVSVRYEVAYPGSPQTVNARVPVHRQNGDWRLDQVAIPVSLELDRAAQRASVAGGRVPDGDTLVFPGAVPIGFDSPYLQLDAAEDTVGFGHPSDVLVYVELSPAGKAAVLAAVRDRLTACLAGRGDAGCPLPDERYVPGSVRGRPAEDLADNLTITLADDPAGLVQVSGEEPVHATSFAKLSFRNRPVTGTGTVVLGLHARAYAVRPLRLTWSRS